MTAMPAVDLNRAMRKPTAAEQERADRAVAAYEEALGRATGRLPFTPSGFVLDAASAAVVSGRRGGR